MFHDAHFPVERQVVLPVEPPDERRLIVVRVVDFSLRAADLAR